MRRAPGKSLVSCFILTFCMTALCLADFGFEQSPDAHATPSEAPAPVYLPPDASGEIMPLFLYALGEPSLFEAAKDRDAVSFRASCVFFPSTTQVAVRIVVNSDGTGQVISALRRSNSETRVDRTTTTISAADAKKFLQLIEKSGFWSMSSIEQNNDKVGRKGYTLDGSLWMLEGVTAGSFHYVYRRNPAPGPFMEIALYLVKDVLARLKTP